MTMLTRPLLIHIIAATAALFFAYHVWQSPFAKTGVQFIAPLVVIIGVHFAWLACARRLTRGYAQRIFARSAVTSVLMIAVLLAGSILTPQPAQAQALEGIGSAILTVVFCVLVIAVVIGIPSLLIWGLFKLIFLALDKKKEPYDPDEPLNDGASLIVVVALLGVASAEGVSDNFSFATARSATTSHLIAAPADTVWDAMQTATSPDIPLPNILASFPQPVAVSVDEGVALGSRRVVDFAGREGAGCLILEVVARTDTAVVFDVKADTTPYANWIAYQRLTYEVIPVGDTTRLDVTLHYDRLLSPAWFFGPAMDKAGALAMDVLASDVKTRSEAAFE